MKNTGAFGRIVRKGLGVLLAVLLLAFLWLVLILGQPQAPRETLPDPTPLPAAGAALQAGSETDLRPLIAAFPAPVMSFMSGSGMVYVNGTSVDTPFQNGYARTVTLYWQTPDGDPLILQSIYPSAAIDLMGKKDYSFSDRIGPTLFGQPSVRMENASSVRLHVISGGGLYVLTLRKPLPDNLSDLFRSLQLFTAD